MIKIEIKKRKCDECGKEADLGGPNKESETPIKWFRLTKLHLLYRRDNIKVDDSSLAIKSINEDKDPDFCSKKCILKWFDKLLTDLMKPKPKTPDKGD
ncbi:hypothetical protein LCGC14_2664760 [marine sediment metagenome]|uniref:Uncharacterized protein n=1 Tax=marine sediment metagenome TaxID=412755 RepID=A0A0F8ZQT9_9ZZZZ